MNTKWILAGGIAAVLLIAGGLTLGGGEKNQQEPGTAEGSLFPDFDLNGATSIVVTHEGGSYTIERDGDRWGLASKDGYPVDLGKIRTLLLAVSGAKILARKTTDPDRHHLLGLGGEPESGDMHWRLLEIDGSHPASVILGQRPANTRRAQVFARRSAENETWLISINGLALPPEETDWIDKEILKIGRDRVRAARITHVDSEVLTVSKGDARDEHYGYLELGDRTLRYDSAPDGLGSALEYLSLNDVARADSLELDESQATRTSIWTWDGLRLDVRLYPIEDWHWATFEVFADPDGAPQADVLGPSPGEEPADEVIAEAEVTPETRQADVDALNARVSGWAFQLPAYNASSLMKRAADYVQPPPDPNEEEGGASEFLSPPGSPSDPDPDPDRVPEVEPGDGAGGE